MKPVLYTREVQEMLRKLAVKMSTRYGGVVDADEFFSVAECAVALKLASFKRAGNFAAWAGQIGRWAMQDYRRSVDHVSRKRRGAGEEVPALVRIDSCRFNLLDREGFSTPPDRGEGAERSESISRWLSRLNPRERRIIEYYYFDGLKDREIAGIFNISGQRTAEVRHIALAKLRRVAKK